MKLVKWALGVLATFLIVLIGGGLMLPKQYSIERSTQIAAPIDKVYALVEDPRQWKRWTVWNQRDPAMQMSYSGAASGAGAAWAWTSANEGSGSMTFTAAEPGQRIAYDLTFPGFDSTSRGELRFDSTEAGTRVVWRMDGEVGGNFILRWFVPFMDGMVGPDFEGGLANLKREAEKV